MKYIIVAVIALLIIGGGFYFFQSSNLAVDNPDQTSTSTPVTSTTTEESGTAAMTSTTSEASTERGADTVIGSSVNGTDITAHHYGEGEDELLFIGGIHGGYSWNTSLVAYELMDYLEENPEAIPENITVTVIPVLNPDGLEKVTGSTERFVASDVSQSEAERIAGRFNANDVDLNRNFDCKWQPKSTWQTKTVSGGSKAFSEPESQAIENYVVKNTPTAIVTWYSSAGGVYSSNCEKGVLPETKTITNLYATAAKYSAHQEFDYYEITGDMVNWFAAQNIPAISVLLTTHEVVEWEKNKAGVDALLKYYAD